MLCMKIILVLFLARALGLKTLPLGGGYILEHVVVFLIIPPSAVRPPGRLRRCVCLHSTCMSPDAGISARTRFRRCVYTCHIYRFFAHVYRRTPASRGCAFPVGTGSVYVVGIRVFCRSAKSGKAATLRLTVQVAPLSAGVPQRSSDLGSGWRVATDHLIFFFVVVATNISLYMEPCDSDDDFTNPIVVLYESDDDFGPAPATGAALDQSNDPEPSGERERERDSLKITGISANRTPLEHAYIIGKAREALAAKRHKKAITQIASESSQMVDIATRGRVKLDAVITTSQRGPKPGKQLVQGKFLRTTRCRFVGGKVGSAANDLEAAFHGSRLLPKTG